jgi:hypothetical protein
MSPTALNEFGKLNLSQFLQSTLDQSVMLLNKLLELPIIIISAVFSLHFELMCLLLHSVLLVLQLIQPAHS